jgi:Leucine-rich repeat (LRR) protein
VRLAKRRTFRVMTLGWDCAWACAAQVTGLDKFVNLEILTLNGCGLTTLEGFPVLQELKTLELADNQLADGCLEALQDAALINMNRLSLAGNRFQTLEALEPLVRKRRTATPSRGAPCRAAPTDESATPPLWLRARAPGVLWERLAHDRARLCRARALPSLLVAERVRQPARPRPLQLPGHGD